MTDVDLLLEVGPGSTLTALALHQIGKGREIAAIASFTRNATVFDALAALWSEGVAIDWSAFYAAERRLRVSLPTYPFQRKLHWIEPPAKQQTMSDKPQEVEFASYAYDRC